MRYTGGLAAPKNSVCRRFSNILGTRDFFIASKTTRGQQSKCVVVMKEKTQDTIPVRRSPKKRKKKITLTTVTNTRPLAPRHSAWDTRCSGPTMTVRLSQSQPCLLVSTLLRVLADLRTFGAAAGHRDDTETRRNILLPIGFRGGGGRGGRGYADVSMQVYAVCVAEAANEKEKQSKRRYVVDEQNKALPNHTV